VLEAASLCAAYSKAPEGQDVQVHAKGPRESSTVTVQGGNPKKYHDSLI
jgi:hypothetical protein